MCSPAALSRTASHALGSKRERARRLRSAPRPAIFDDPLEIAVAERLERGGWAGWSISPWVDPARSASDGRHS
jgi:hypothetical protein